MPDVPAPQPVPYATETRTLRDLIEQTFRAGRECLDHWDKLRPLADRFRDLLSAEVDKAEKAGTLDLKEAQSLILTQSQVVDRMARAGQQFVKQGDVMARLLFVIQGGPPAKKDPGKLHEREMVATVVETTRQLSQERGVCLACGGRLQVVEVTPR